MCIQYSNRMNISIELRSNDRFTFYRAISILRDVTRRLMELRRSLGVADNVEGAMVGVDWPSFGRFRDADHVVWYDLESVLAFDLLTDGVNLQRLAEGDPALVGCVLCDVETAAVHRRSPAHVATAKARHTQRRAGGALNRVDGVVMTIFSS